MCAFVEYVCGGGGGGGAHVSLLRLCEAALTHIFCGFMNISRTAHLWTPAKCFLHVPMSCPHAVDKPKNVMETSLEGCHHGSNKL